MDTITINKAQLEGALAEWERAHRAGETRTYDETKQLPIAQVAQESSDYLWGLLTAEVIG